MVILKIMKKKTIQKILNNLHNCRTKMNSSPSQMILKFTSKLRRL